tara:strand:+ start:287 stop:1261 length:975 start_codon:yes stop_codon:yes gene_type:complete
MRNKRNFVGGEYSNKFPQNENKMRTMVGAGSDMSFSGSFNKFPSTNSSNGEQSGFSRVNVDNQSAGILNESKSYFSSSNDDSFNPRNNHSNAAGVSRPMPTPSYRGGVVSPLVGGASSGLEYGSQSTGRTLSGSSNPLMEVQQSGNSIQRIPVSTGLYGDTANQGGMISNVVVGASKRRKKRPSAQTTAAAAARQIQTGANTECTPPSVFCKAGDYLGCHPQHKCNSGLRQRQIGGAKQVNKKSRRASDDRIAVIPVKGKGKAMGKNCQDGTHCAVGETCRNGECVPVRGELKSSKMNASGCGYNNFHHKSGFSGESRRKNIFK